MSTGTLAAPPTAGGRSNLARMLAAGEFAVAVEISPPAGADPTALRRQVEMLRGCADAYNVTDNQSARIRMSSLAACIMIRQAGLEPIVQLTCRDRNRLGLQADLLGAAAFRITNVLALSGDHPACGDHPHVRPVGDVDSVNLVRMIRMMRDDRVFENGQPIPEGSPDFFIGAVANPFAPPFDFRPLRLAKKVLAGAQFIQTQLVFNLERFREYMRRVVELGLHEKVFILAGVGPVKTAAGLEFLANKVAGVDVPPALIDRLRRLPKPDQARAGLELACEIAEEVRRIEGVRGLHIMSMRAADIIPELLERLGLYPRPRLEA